jgi:hypothetical protein
VLAAAFCGPAICKPASGVDDMTTDKKRYRFATVLKNRHVIPVGQSKWQKVLLWAMSVFAAISFPLQGATANFARTFISPIQIQVSRTSLYAILKPAQLAELDSVDGPFTLYIFPQVVNQSIVVAARDNCLADNCLTFFINLSAITLPNSVVVDKCRSDINSSINIVAATKFGPAIGSINANCSGNWKGRAPTFQEGFSEFSD